LLNQIQKTNKENVKTLFFVEDEDNSEIKNIKWPTIGQFNTDLGIQKIEEFMKNVKLFFEVLIFDSVLSF
jgi:hypothetical protein